VAAGAWVFTNAARTNLLDGTVPVASGTFKMALYPSTSDLTVASTTYAAVTNEHANQGAPGYETGGASVDLTLAGTTTVTIDIATDPVWTATGGSIAAKWAAIYEVAADILCFALCDSGGATITATVGNTFTVAANVSGVATLA
jgi:hypothetical protein